MLLYSAEAWALSAAQLERLEVVQRGFLRMALPVRMRRRRGDAEALSNVALRRFYGLPSPVGTMLGRKQMRWLGHLGRIPDGRLPAQLLTAQRLEQGGGAAGCRRATLLGSHGTAGVYPGLLKKHLTWGARREFFDGSHADWHVLAEKKDNWKKFTKSIIH